MSLTRDPLRVYLDPAEIMQTGQYAGYPFAWFRGQEAIDEAGGELPGWLPIKDYVREQQGHRCERCGHPYRKGEHGNGHWSACDEGCDHGGPVSVTLDEGDTWVEHNTAEVIMLGGASNVASMEAEWRILTVHHLNGVKHDCRWWNLAALCQRCHLTIQAKVYMEREHPFPHTPWFRPHAAGWYAVKYLGADLSREETRSREDELLALEQTHEPLF